MGNVPYLTNDVDKNQFKRLYHLKSKMTYGGSLMSSYFTDSILSGEITRKVSIRMKNEKSKDYCKADHNNAYCFFL